MNGDPGAGRESAPGPAAGALVELSAALASMEREDLGPVLLRAAEAAGPAAVEEAILQSHLFLGFPAALDGLRAWRRLGGETAAAGPAHVERTEDPADREGRGEEVCRRVYGAAYGDLRRNVRRLHPDLDAWMIRDGYGKVLGRDGLDLATRELCIVATLAADGTHGEPLHSHLRGALRAGADPSDVEGALETGLACRPAGRDATEARDRWRRVRDRIGDAGDT